MRTAFSLLAKDRPTAAVAELHGHIDRVEGGFIHGWAWNDSAPESPIEIEVRAGGVRVAGGTAHVYREDLRAAGIGDGRHGFVLPIDVFSALGSELTLHGSRGEAVTSNAFEVTREETGLWAEFHEQAGYAIRGVLHSSMDLGGRELFVSEEGEVVARHSVVVNAGVTSFEAALPAEVFDGAPHLLSLGLVGAPHPLTTASIRLEPVLTPWQYLQRNHRNGVLASLSTAARYRYASLDLQLAHHVDGESLPTLSDIHRAHAVVVEGYENRTRYPELVLPAYADPTVTVIVPVYNNIALTYHALASIALAFNHTSYEVIVADDCSTDETLDLEGMVRNVRVVRHPSNLGFLRSVNRASAHARGKYIVLLNNDTEVTSGWLDELVAPFEDETVGLVGSKLLNSDGSLQEAGAIVWSSGQPWNIGYGKNPWQPEYSYARDVDYVSGAALCIPRSLWERVGGFSEEFAPAYYEDTDLAFKVREAGHRVRYAPLSVVFHFEGKSHGRDTNVGIKRHQALNEPKFREKWLQAYRHNGPEGQDLHLHKDRSVTHRLLMIDYTTPCPSQDAGSYAAIQEMRLFQKLGFKITFVPENMAHLGDLTTNLQRMGVEVLHAPFYSSVEEVLRRRRGEFDVAYITRFDVAERHMSTVRRHGVAKVMINVADLHFLRSLRRQLASGTGDLAEPLHLRDRELSTLREADAVLSYSEHERAIILSHNLRSDNLFACPWVLEPKPEGPGFGSRAGIAFLGGFKHHPNEEAVAFFAREVMPRLQKRLPGVCFHVYGSHMPESLRALETETIRMEGFVESLEQVFQDHRVFVAPLLSGAGVKGKVLEAMSYGTPCVLSSVAAESTGLSHGVSAWIATDVDDWVEGVARCYTDEKMWSTFYRNSRLVAESQYSEDRGLAAARAALRGIGIYAQAVTRPSTRSPIHSDISQGDSNAQDR